MTEKIVPVMAVLYVLGGLMVLGDQYRAVPAAFAQIFVLAFNPQAMPGGVLGVTVTAGGAVRRGARSVFK